MFGGHFSFKRLIVSNVHGMGGMSHRHRPIKARLSTDKMYHSTYIVADLFLIVAILKMYTNKLFSTNKHRCRILYKYLTKSYTHSHTYRYIFKFSYCFIAYLGSR